MRSNTTRRKRWYTRLLQLDDAMKISQPVLIEQLFDCAGLTEDQKLAVRTVTNDVVDFDAVCNAMRKLFHDIEKKEAKHVATDSLKSSRNSENRHQRHSRRNANAFRSLGRRGWQSKSGGFRPRAHVAEADDSDSDVDPPPPPCAWNVIAANSSPDSDHDDDENDDNICILV